MATSLNKRLAPVETLMFDGIAQRVQRVTGVPTFWDSAGDGVQVLKRSGTSVRYPYITLTHESTQEATDRGNSHVSSHRGKHSLISDDQRRAFKVMFLPADFHIKFQYFGDSSVHRRVVSSGILFARRNGWLKFSIPYGAASFDINPEVPDTIDLPLPESDQSGPKVYKLDFNLKTRGFISYPELLEGQIIDTLNLAMYVGGGEISNSDLAWEPEDITSKPTTTSTAE